MAIIRLANSYLVYKLTEVETFKFAFVKECKTKGEAAKWIYEQGEKDASYFIQETFQK